MTMPFFYGPDPKIQMEDLEDGIANLFTYRISGEKYRIAPWYSGLTMDECLEAAEKAIKRSFKTKR